MSALRRWRCGRTPHVANDPSRPADLSDSAALLWAQAQQQLSQQNADLDALRTRAIAMLSVATLVAGLFGTRLPDVHPSPRAVIAVTAALALFAASVVLAILVAAPRKGWLFTFKLDALLGLVDDGRAAPMDVTRNLATWAEDARSENTGKLDGMYGMFRWVCVLVGLQVVAWAIAVL